MPPPARCAMLARLRYTVTNVPWLIETRPCVARCDRCEGAGILRAMATSGSLYQRVYRIARWCIRSSGPLAPWLNRLRRQIREQAWFRQRVPNVANPLAVDGLHVYHDGAADPTIQALAMGAYEPETVRLFASLLRPGMTVLDVGAHIGYFTLLAARAVGANGRVVAFEPLPSNAQLLRRNVEANGFDERVTVVERAVADHAGEMSLHDSGRDAGTATLYAAGGQVINVGTTSLDGWAAEQQWPSIDVIKMDIEGAEVAALAGMRELKKRNPHLELVCEFNPTTLGYAGLEPDSLLTALQACGFTDISIVGARLQHLSLPADIPKAVGEARKWDLINLYCH